MFIILGSPRSGTTLLASILNLHSDILVLDQTDFIVPWALASERVINNSMRLDSMISFATEGRYSKKSFFPYFTKQELIDLITLNDGDLVKSLVTVYGEIAFKTGKRLVGDKSVSDISYFPVLNHTGIFDGEIKIIHIVRDLRAVFSSLKKLGWIKDRHTYPRSWNNTNMSVNEILRKKSHYHFLKYEDFVRAPEKNLKNLLNFLGLEPKRINIHDMERGMEYVGYNEHIKLQKPISTKWINSWEEELSKAEIKKCEKESLEGLKFFGYL